MTGWQTQPVFDDDPSTVSISKLVDAELACRAATHPEALAELYRRNVGSVYRYLIVKAGNVQDAQDLTAQTFLAVVESIRSFRGSGTFIAWLLSIAHRKATDFFRRKHASVSLDELDETGDDTVTSDSWLQMDAVVSQHVTLERVKRAMRCIAPERAEAIQLCLFAELSSADAARIMGKNEVAVRQLLSRGIHDLRQRLAASPHDTDE